MADARHFAPSVVRDVLSRVESFDGRAFVAVLDGPGGSGKSTLARELAAAFAGTVAIVHGDDFYADLDDDYRAGLDAASGYREYFDWRRLRDQVFVPARAGEPVTYQRYDWAHARLGDRTAVPEVDLLLVEGVYTGRPELHPLADLVVWVTTSEAERRRRQVERGENDDIWIQRWMAAENHYLENVRTPAPNDVEVLGD